ncbi:restriction endonuclease subunit S [Paraburkholderia dinghuensis]|uniref:Restriction endonuclease subunit S n=1 Tax=Paraburkholderia dinghuensis TaxID=2305225 RepID=A0A3N6MFT1_9BURK|nr:restriction endonuclease subunit S [Paraburkholderia dinghuensis]RQG99824.1 restriction endonuclease subunit S [Paraburkholderia dinghuensis]
MKLTEGFNLLATAPDGIKRLRELILSLAVQGKLVPQDPNDEPASELLRHIRAEKGRLIAEGKIKKDKPLPAIGDEEKPFDLPQGWEWVRMPQIAENRLGKMLDKAKNTGTAFPYLRNTNVQWHRFVLDDIKEIYLETHELEEFRLRRGDLLICEGGEPGRCAIWRDEVDEMYFQKALHRVRTIGGVLPEFIAQCLENDAFSGRLNEYFTGATIKHFAGQELNRYTIPLPPLAEQSRIVAKVEELMALCDALEARGKLEAEQHARLTATLFDALAASESAHQLQENWTRLASSFDLILDRPEAVDALEQTLLQLAVRGLLVPQDRNDEPASELLKQIRAEKDRLIAEGKIKKDKPLPEIGEDEKPFELPQGWEWVRIGDLCRPVSSGSTPAANLFLNDGGVPYLKVYNIRNQNIDFEYKRQFISEELHRSKLRRSMLYPGDVVMNIVGPPLGKIAIIPDSHPEWNCNQAIAFFGLIPPMSPKYIWTYLCENSFLKNIELIGTAGQDNISVTKSKNIPVPLPPLTEQSRIVARVEALRALCATLRERLTTSQKIQTHLAETLVETAD